MKLIIRIALKVILLFIMNVFLFLIYKNRRDEKLRLYSELYSIKIDTLRIRYERIHIKSDMKKYPYIDKSIKSLIQLGKSEMIFDYVKFKRTSLLKDDTIAYLLKVLKETENIKDKDVKKIYEDYCEIKDGMLRVSHPFRYRIDPFIVNGELKLKKFILRFHSGILMLILKIINLKIIGKLIYILRDLISNYIIVKNEDKKIKSERRKIQRDDLTLNKISEYMPDMDNIAVEPIIKEDEKCWI